MVTLIIIVELQLLGAIKFFSLDLLFVSYFARFSLTIQLWPLRSNSQYAWTKLSPVDIQ